MVLPPYFMFYVFDTIQTIFLGLVVLLLTRYIIRYIYGLITSQSAEDIRLLMPELDVIIPVNRMENDSLEDCIIKNEEFSFSDEEGYIN